MVIYDLVCDSGHDFEVWFKQPDDFATQKTNGLLTCPYCNSANISKKLTPPKVARKSNSASNNAQADHTAKQATEQNTPIDKAKALQAYTEQQKMLTKIHAYIDRNFTNVGNQFAAKALQIHRGETPLANIIGTATKKDLKELHKEGVHAVPLPPKPDKKDELN